MAKRKTKRKAKRKPAKKPVDEICFEPGNTRGWPKTKRQLDWALRVVEEQMTYEAAAVEVGFAATTARKKAHQLAKAMRPFLAFLQEKKNAIVEHDFEVTTSRVLREITALAMANHVNYVRRVTVEGKPYWAGKPIDELSEAEQVAVKSYRVGYIKTDDQGEVPDFKYELHDKPQNVFMLGKHLGMFNEKIMLELGHREAQAKRFKFSELPTDKIMEIMETLEEFKRMALEAARDADAIPGQARQLN